MLPPVYVDPLGLEARRKWKSEEEKRRALCEALANSKNLQDFINKYDPSFGGELGGDLFNLEYQTAYGDTDIDWMLTLLAAHQGRAPGLAGPLLEGRDPGKLYFVGKSGWILIDAWTDENVDVDFGRYGQENEPNAVLAARGLLNGDVTLSELFPGLDCGEPCPCAEEASKADKSDSRRDRMGGRDRGRSLRRGSRQR